MFPAPRSATRSAPNAMKTNNGFWDSRVLVPLSLVRQTASQDLRQLWRESSRIVVWSGATVEIRSAHVWLNRSGDLNTKGLRLAQTKLGAMRRIWREIITGDKLRFIAEELPDTYGLQALDSFQLAAALVWRKEKPKGKLFFFARVSD